jgi:hypothetical protein
MPNQLDPSKKRVTFTEFTDVFAKLQKKAAADRVDVSTVLRAATQDFVLKHKAKKWEPVPYSQPGHNLRRITYAEWEDVLSYIEKVIVAERTSQTTLLRKIIYAYLVKAGV